MGVWKLVAGWAPGADNLVLPPEAGFPEEVGTTHYTPDRSIVLLPLFTWTSPALYAACQPEE